MSIISNKRKLEFLGYDITKRRITELRNAIDISKLIKLTLTIHSNNNGNQDPIIKKIATELLDLIDISEGLSFSELDNHDEDKLQMEKAGIITIDMDNCKLQPSKTLEIYLDRINKRCNLKAEVSIRTVIDIILLESMERNPENKKLDDKLASYGEYDLEPIKVNDCLILKGKIDYVTCNRSENDNGMFIMFYLLNIITLTMEYIINK